MRQRQRVGAGQLDPELGLDLLRAGRRLDEDHVLAGGRFVRRVGGDVDARRAAGLDDGRGGLLRAGDLGRDGPVGMIRHARGRRHRHVLGRVVVDGEREREGAVGGSGEHRVRRVDRDVAGSLGVDADRDREDVLGVRRREAVTRDGLGRGGSLGGDGDVEARRGVRARAGGHAVDHEAAAVQRGGPAFGTPDRARPTFAWRMDETVRSKLTLEPGATATAG